MSPGSNARRATRGFARYHRGIGVAAALFAVLLAVTGVLLNHTGRLALDQRYVEAEWLLDWYGIDVPRIVSYPVGKDHLSQVGDRLYFNERELGEFGPLLGAVAARDVVVAAVEGRLILLTTAGDLIEVLGGAQGVPAGMRAIGITDERIVVRAAHGDYLADADIVAWRERATVSAAWAEPAPPPPALASALARSWRGKGLPLERVVRDLHSGRIFGGAGYLVMDFAALALVLLAGSGIWLWSRRRQFNSNLKG